MIDTVVAVQTDSSDLSGMSAAAASAIGGGLTLGVKDSACLILEFVSSDGRCPAGNRSSTGVVSAGHGLE
jgi:hypothetical protein